MSFPLALLAGGRATRLYPLTHTVPKSLVPIQGRPFIDYQLRLFRRAGIEQVVICLGYLGEQIVDYVGNGDTFDLQVTYSHDGDNLLGTGGCLKKALHLLGSDFFVCYGDSYLTGDYAAVQAAYEANQKEALMTVYKNENQFDISNVICEQGRVVMYNKKPTTPLSYIDYGLSILSEKLLTEFPINEAFDLEEVYQRAIRAEKLAAYEMTERFYEIGTFKGKAALEMFLKHSR